MTQENPLPRKSIVAAVGPTGSGKTKLGVTLARKFGGVIISADSRQVYRGLDVGTNKEGQPGVWAGQPARIIDDVPQLMVDIVEPGARFTLHEWLAQSRAILNLIWDKGSLPVVVGGTGLYVSALLDGYQPGDGRYAKSQTEPNFSSLVLMPDVDRATLYERSDQRFERIFDRLIVEVESLVENGVSHDWLEAIGLDYRFASYFLTRRMDREIAITEFQQASRRYIRRQLTWWRHHNQPVPIANEDHAISLVAQFVSRTESDTF